MGKLSNIKKYLSDLQRGKKPFPKGFTVLDWNCCASCYNDLVISKVSTTVTEVVANTFRDFGFSVIEHGVGWRILNR